MIFRKTKAEKRVQTLFASSISAPPEPVDLGYTVDANHDAHHCEFFIDSFGKGAWTKAMYHIHWIEAHYLINVRSPGHTNDRVLNSGLYVNHSPQSGSSVEEESFYLGEEIGPDRYKVFMSYELDYQSGRKEISLRRRINAVAFFIDVYRHGDDRVERLWISNHGNNYTLDEIFEGVPTYDRTMNLGSITYVEQPSPIFNQKSTCVW